MYIDLEPIKRFLLESGHFVEYHKFELFDISVFEIMLHFSKLPSHDLVLNLTIPDAPHTISSY